MVGFVGSDGSVGSWCTDSHDGQAANTTTSGQSTSACIINTATAASAIDRRATFTSFNSDGFTVNFTTLDATVGVNSWVMYIAVNAPFVKVGNVDQRTTTGTTDVTTTGFTPRAIMLGGNATTATNAVQQDARFNFGVAISVATQSLGSFHDDDATDPTVNSGSFITGKILKWITAVSSGAPTTLIEAAISAITLGSFTINFTTVDATARKIIYMAIGDAIVASTRVPRFGFINFQNPGIA